MTKKNKKNPINCLVICHGKSEFKLVHYLKTNLRLPVEIDADKKGEKSIQITSLMHYLKGRNYNTKKGFQNKFKKLIINNDLRIFIIMDVDDCDNNQKLQFKNKSMFKDHWSYDYITPIFNDLNLEDVIDKSKLTKMTSKTDVVRIFPVDQFDDDIEAIEDVALKLASCADTNIDELFNYLLSNRR